MKDRLPVSSECRNDSIQTETEFKLRAEASFKRTTLNDRLAGSLKHSAEDLVMKSTLALTVLVVLGLIEVAAADNPNVSPGVWRNVMPPTVTTSFKDHVFCSGFDH